MILDEVALTFVPNLGTRGISHLTDIYEDASAIYGATEHHLACVAELRRDIITHITQRAGYSEAERELRYCEQHNIGVTSYHDNLYPPLLREVADRPHILYSMGDIGVLQSKHILAVVGTRRISTYGQSVCIRLLTELAEMFPDLVVVSGLAFGVDATAHHTAISAGVRTVAIVPSKLPEVTPAQHSRLAKEIVDEGGAIISELNSQSKQNGAYYIPRNRIIAGISDGVFVVESAIDGGTLSTVRYADSYAYPVMALPGRITDPMSEGTNHIIKSGLAQLVTSAEDIANCLGWQRTERAKVVECEVRDCSPREMKILECFADGGAYTTDEVALRSGLSTSEASAMLLELELSGVVHQCAGNKYEKM